MMIYITGDIHGSKIEVENRIAQINNPTEEDIIIICGDAGLEYGNQIQGSCKKVMKKFPGSWIVLRGNHDTRYWRDHTSKTKNEIVPESKWHFEEKYNNSVLVQDKFPNIHYIKDIGGIYTFGEYNCLFIPGAYFIDKFYRLSKNLSYEYEEQLNYKEWKELYEVVRKNVNKINFVIGHTFPICVEDKLQYLFLDFINQDSVDKSSEKWINEIMSNGIYKSPNFKKYFGGHYHDDKILDSKHILIYKKVLKMKEYV